MKKIFMKLLLLYITELISKISRAVEQFEKFDHFEKMNIFIKFLMIFIYNILLNNI